MWVQVSLAVLVTLTYVQGHVRQEELPPNRCLAGQACFPSRLEMAEFAATLTGSLYQPSDPQYSSLVRNNNNRVTRHPALIVLAGDVADVQKAMKFARKFQLMVTSQSGVNEPTGRSTYDGSLNINLSQLSAVFAANINTTRSEYGEITAQPAATWENLYQRARLYNRDVVAPNTYKSPVGGTVGDGGIGPLVRIYGLVSDNLLEAQMVLADGSLVTVSDYTVTQDFGDGLKRSYFDRNLFASITAGGVGPWGVVVSYTFKMVQAPASITRVRLQYNLWQDGEYVGQNILESVVGALGAMPLKWGGYLYISGMTSNDLPNTKGGLVVNLFYYAPFKSDADYDFIDNIRNLDSAASLVSDRTINETGIMEFELNQPSVLNSVNIRYYQFNTLLQTIEPAINDEAQKLSEAFLFAANSPTIESNYFCTGQIMGGAVANAPRLIDLVNPKIRSSYMSFSCYLVFPGRGLDDSYYVDHAMDFRKLLEPFGSGKARYWAEPDLPNWKQELHGDKYGLLIETKLRYDVDNYLWCPNCVGSDFRVRGDCGQPAPDRSMSGHAFLQYGNKLGGYISDQRYMVNKQRQMEMAESKRARLIYISQMTIDN